MRLNRSDSRRDLRHCGSGLKDEPSQGALRADPCSQRVAKGGGWLGRARQTLEVMKMDCGVVGGAGDEEKEQLTAQSLNTHT